VRRGKKTIRSMGSTVQTFNVNLLVQNVRDEIVDEATI
jgi:hypothetical protein